MKEANFRFIVRQFYTKLTNWEYWPFEIVYLPIFIYWIWLSIKARSLFFFSASNPSIETGGMLGESKSAILELIDQKYKPVSLRIEKGSDFENVLSLLSNAGFQYPFIIKPDVGERGNGVAKISNAKELQKYLEQSTDNLIIQEFVNYPIELGVFYYRFPSSKEGTVSSIVLKDFLKVKGDGILDVYHLMLQSARAGFQLKRLTETKPDLMKYKPQLHEEVLVEPVGNHCRGTTFLDACDLIDEDLRKTFDDISKDIKGFYYGRFDLKCTSIDDLKKGEGIKIMELNGAGAEPAHIYQPGASLWRAYRVLFKHWKVMYEISKQNHRLGFPYMTLKEASEIYRKIKRK